MTEQHNFGKWLFMMEYCKTNGWSPADSYYWSRAEEAYYISVGARK